VQYRTVHTVRDVVLSSHRKKPAVPVSANANFWIKNFIYRSLPAYLPLINLWTIRIQPALVLAMRQYCAVRRNSTCKFTWAKSVTYASLRSVTHVSGRALKVTGILNRPSPEVSGRFWPAHHFLPKISLATFAFARICEGMCLQDLTLRNLDRCLPGATLG